MTVPGARIRKTLARMTGTSARYASALVCVLITHYVHIPSGQERLKFARHMNSVLSSGKWVQLSDPKPRNGEK